MDPSVLVAIAISSLVTIAFFIYKYLTQRHGYWESQKIASIKPHILDGTTQEFYTKSAIEVEDDRYQKYGRIFGSYDFNKRTIYIAEPELIKQILVRDFNLFVNRRKVITGIEVMDSGLTLCRGEQWKRIRSVCTPSFTGGKLRKMNPHFMEATESLLQNFSEAAEAKKTLDVMVYFSAFAIDVIGLTAFGIRVDSLKNPDHPFLVNSINFTNSKGFKWFTRLMFVPFAIKIFGGILCRSIFGYFCDLSEEIIKKRTNDKEASQRIDLIQLMLDAREGKLENEKVEDPVESNKAQLAWNVKKTLSDEEILAQAITFILSSNETTSATLGFLVYELARNPDIQDKLYQEVKDAHQKHGEFNYDVVRTMTYLDAAISEVLRLHTVAVRLEREVSEDYVLGYTGIVVPKDAGIIIPVHSIHHDPEWFPDPYMFDPDRFLPENRDSIVPYTYLPFGEGPRNCIAMRFALLGIKLCIAMLVKDIKFVATEETAEKIEYCAGNIHLAIPKTVNLRVEKRT